MAQYIVAQGQSLMDVALQVYGSHLQISDLAADNGLGLTDTLTAGQVLEYDPDKATQPDIVARYKLENRIIATLNFKGIIY